MGNDGWVAGTDAVGSMCTHMVSWVVGNDSWGGFGPNQGQLPPTSPLALFSNGGGRERERERAWYVHFFSHFTPQHEQQNNEVSGGGCNFFWFPHI